MKLAMLGPLSVETDSGTVRSGGIANQILAILAATANTPIPAERLADFIWPGDALPRSNSLQAHISRWRKSLGRDRIPFGPVGYTLEVASTDLDILQFEEVAALSRARRDAGDLTSSIELCERALALWRGTPFSGLAEHALLIARRAELEALRSEILLARAEMLSETGEYAKLATEYAAFAAEDRWNEPLHRLVATARYQLGDQVSALRLLSQLQTRLRNELGLDLSPASQGLREQILRQEPELHQASRQAPLPTDTDVDRLMKRLLDLPAATRQLLDTAALAGNDLDTAQLAQALRLSGPDLADAMHEALTAGVLERSHSEIQFASPQLPERIIAQLPPGEAVRWHRILGESLLHRSDDVVVRLRAATHLALAAVADPEAASHAVALDHSLAEMWFDRANYADAAFHAKRAIESVDHTGATAQVTPDRSQLWLLYADALQWDGQLEAAMRAYLRAAECAGIGPADLAHAAVQYESCSLRARRHRTGAQDASVLLLERAIAAFPEPGSIRIDLLSSFAQALRFAGVTERAGAVGDDAVTEARTHGDAHQLGRTLLRRLAAHDPVTHADARLELAREAAVIARELDADEFEADAVCTLVPELMRHGLIAEAELAITRVEALTEAQGNTLHRWKVPMWRAAIALATGDFDEAEVLISDFLRSATRDGYGDVRRVHAFQSILLAIAREMPQAAAEILREFDDDIEFEPWIATRLLVAARCDDWESVKQGLVPWSARRFRFSHPFQDVQVFAALLVAETVATSGSETDRERLLQLLTPSIGLNQILGNGAALIGTAGHGAAALVRANGDHEHAAQLLAEAEAHRLAWGLCQLPGVTSPSPETRIAD